MLRDNIAIKKFAAINKTFLQVKDIAALMDCAESKAGSYRRKFLKEYEEEHDYFAQLVPTTEFLEYYKIDIERIRENYIVIHQIRKENRYNADAKELQA